MLKYEIQKNCTVFQLVLASVMLLLNIGVTLYQCRDAMVPEYASIIKAQDELLELAASGDGFDTLYNDFLSRENEFNLEFYKTMQSTDGKAMRRFENKVIDFPSYGDAQLFHDVQKIRMASSEYNKAIGNLLRDAALQVREQEAEHDYTYLYNRNVILRYDRFLEKELPIVAVRGWNEYFSQGTSVVFLLIGLTSIAGGVFCRDMRAGMTNILRVCRNGNRKLIASKLLFVTITAVVFTMVFTLLPLVFVACTYGLSSPDISIQILDTFVYCPFDMSIGTFLIMRIAARIICMVCFSILIAVIGQLFSHEAPALTMAALIIGAGYRLAAIDPTSKYAWLTKYSITEWMEGTILFDKYRGISLFGHCVDYTMLILLILVVLTVIISVISLFCHPSNRITVHRSEQAGKHRSYPKSLLAWESYKLLINESGIMLIVAAVVVKVLLSNSYYGAPLSSDEQIYRGYLAEVSGEITDEKLSFIEAEKQYIEKSLAEYASAQTAWRQGEMTAEEFSGYQNRYYYAEYYERGFRKLYERMEYLVDMNQLYPNVEFAYDEGMNRWLNASVDFLLVLTLALMFCNVFSVEYVNGFDKIQRLTRLGRVNVYRAKILLVLLLGICICIVYTGIDYMFMNLHFPMDYGNIPVQSLPLLSGINVNLTVMEYMVIQTLTTRLGYLMFAILAASLSCIVRGYIKSVIVSVATLVIPYLLNMNGINLFDWFSFTRYVTSIDIVQNCPTFVICSICSLLLMAASYVKWSGRGMYEVNNK